MQHSEPSPRPGGRSRGGTVGAGAG